MGGEQMTLDGGAIPMEVAARQRNNPLLPIYGPGPEGATCGGCAHLFRVGGIASHVLKCALRRNTSSEATDHRAKWTACAKYEPGRDETREVYRMPPRG